MLWNWLLLSIFTVLLANPRHHVVAKVCGFEADDVQELVVEIFTPEPGSSTMVGHGPAEVAGGEETINIFVSAPDIESLEGLDLRIWRECNAIGDRMPCKPMMSGDTTNSVELMLYVANEWVGGHENDVLVQIVDRSGAIQAQGRSSCTVHPTSNQTEGTLHLLASQLEAPGYGSWLHPWSDACSPQTLMDVRFCQKPKHTQIKQLNLSVAECSQPRAPLRMYQITAARWSADRRFDLFLPKTATSALDMPASGGQRGMLNIRGEGIPKADKCTYWEEDHEVTGDQIAGGMTAYLLVGVTGGSVEHLGHFFLDFVFNLFRLMAAGEADWWKDKLESGSDDIELDSRGIVLLDDMRESSGDLPPRRFYPLVHALVRKSWKALGELPHGVCFHKVIMGFGGLEVIRARDASSIRSVVHAPRCRGVALYLQHRVIRHYGLEPRAVGGRGDSTLLYLSREDTGWRRLVNERELVAAWNDNNPSDQLEMTSLHRMEFGAQLALLQRARVMVGVNGGQINALFFLPEGSTCAAIFAMRWTDQNFGYVYLSWLRHRGVRYIQYDATRGGTTNLDWLTQAQYGDDWRGSMRGIRDADIRIPQAEFDDFLREVTDLPAAACGVNGSGRSGHEDPAASRTEAVSPDGSGRYDASDDTAELEKVQLTQLTMPGGEKELGELPGKWAARREGARGARAHSG